MPKAAKKCVVLKIGRRLFEMYGNPPQKTNNKYLKYKYSLMVSKTNENLKINPIYKTSIQLNIFTSIKYLKHKTFVLGCELVLSVTKSLLFVK